MLRFRSPLLLRRGDRGEVLKPLQKYYTVHYKIFLDRAAPLCYNAGHKEKVGRSFGKFSRGKTDWIKGNGAFSELCAGNCYRRSGVLVQKWSKKSVGLLEVPVN